MIHYYWGANQEESRRAARAEFLKARGKEPEAPSFDLAGEGLTLEGLQEVLSARPLLGGGIIAFFDHLADNSVLIKLVSEKLKDLVQSDSHFIFWEGEKEEELAEQIGKVGGKVKEFKVIDQGKSFSQETANLFATSDALGNRDRKQAWLLYHEALRHGVPAEEVFWKFAWKIKTLLLVATAPEGSPLPLKPYPLSQAKRQLKNYKLAELVNLSSRLTRLYHDARRGLTEFEPSLERLILEA